MAEIAWFFAGTTTALLLVWPRTRELLHIEWLERRYGDRWWFGFGSPSVPYGPLTLIARQLVLRAPWLCKNV